LHGLGLFDGNDTILANLVHHIRDQIANLFIRGRIGRDMTNIFLGVNFDRHLAEFFDNRLSRHLNAMLDKHWVVASFQGLEAFVHDGMSEHSGSGGAITGDVVGLGCGFLEQLGAHILKWVFKFDLLRDRNAVMRDHRRTELAVHSHVTALGPEGCANRIGNDIHASPKLAAGVF
jgi:hypothetical protein